MVKVLVIGDPHIKKNNIQEIDEMVKSVLDTAKTLSPDIIVNLGDTLDQHAMVHTDPLNRALGFIMELSKISPTYVLIGNHDLQSNNGCFLTTDHAFNAMKYIPNVFIIDTPRMVTVGDNNFVMCPYVYPGRLFEALKTITTPENASPVTAYFLHQELKGVKLGIINSSIGDEWPESMPLAISGHIHDYQRPQPNIVYPGTPIQHGFGDDPHKTISLFTFANNEWKEERLELKTTKKIIVHLTPSTVGDYKPQEGKIIKIIVTGTSSEIKVCSRLESIRNLRGLGIKVTFKITDTPKINLPSEGPSGTRRSFINILQHIVSTSDRKRRILERLL
jgi:DNA repair exonuclease SbcCD nuclease subunit